VEIDASVEVDATAEAEPTSEEEMTNFASKEKMDEVSAEISADTILPEGAVDWVYSSWNFSNKKPKKFTAIWWTVFSMKFIKIVLDSFKFFTAFYSRYGFYNYGRYCAKAIL